MDLPPFLHIRPSLAWEGFPDEIVAIDLERGIYFNLTAGGADVFRCFASPATEAQVAAHMAKVDFELGGIAAPPATVSAALSKLVADLVANHLLVPTKGAAQSLPSAATGTRTVESLVLHRHDDLQNLLALDPVHDAATEGWPARRT